MPEVRVPGAPGFRARSRAGGVAPADEVLAAPWGRGRRWRAVTGVVCAAAVMALLGCGEEPTSTQAPAVPVPSVAGDRGALPDPARDTGDSVGASGGVSDPGGGAALADAKLDGRGGATASDAVEGPASGAGSAAGDGDAGRSLEPVEVVEALEGSQDGFEAPDGDDAVDEAVPDLPASLSFQFEPGGLFFELGFRDFWPDRYDLDAFSDEVAVRADSVLVSGGAVRGLVQNMSQRLFARHVTVSVGDRAWVFPLTVQPGEVVPFEIEGYAGPSDPGSIGFEVSAQLVPEPDPKRSFHVTESPGIWADTWDEIGYRLHAYPHITRPEGVSGDDWVQVYETLIRLREPTSHPSVADEVEGLVVEDLRVFLTRMDDQDRVLKVSEMTPYEVVYGEGPAPVRRVDRSSSFHMVFLPNYDMNFGITVGGAHDGYAG